MAIDHLPSDQITDCRRRFHEERLATIAAGNLPAPAMLDDKPGTIVIHILPFSALALGGHRVAAIELANWPKLQLYEWGSRDWRVNVDGVLVWTSRAYVQAYWIGILEAVGRGVVHTDHDLGSGPQPIICSAEVENRMVALVLANLRYLWGLGFAPPFAILTALLGATGARLDGGQGGGEPPTIDRSPLRFTEVVVEAMPVDEQAAARVLRPVFDQLANAGGRATSRNFAPGGSWNLSGDA